MGRYTGTPPVTPSLTSQGPIGGIAAVFRSGADYKAVGEVISRAAYPVLSSLFPRIGAFTSQAVTAVSTNKWAKMAYGNGMFVAVGTDSAGAATDKATYSRDGGKTWALSTLPSSVIWRNIIYAGGQFVALGAAAVASSPDGIVWTAKTADPSGGSALAYGAGLYVTGYTGATAYTSPDLVTWTARTLPVSAPWIAVAFGGGTFAFTSTNGTGTATSPDGITWTSRTMPSGSWNSITYGNGLFVAVNLTPGVGANVCTTSPDGAAWTNRPIPPDVSSFGLLTVVFGNGVFYATSQTANRTVISYDGMTWIEKVTPASTDQKAVSYGAGVFASLYQTAGQITYAENLTDSDYMYLSGTAGQFVRVK